MIEDKLREGERIRLESISQANQLLAMRNATIQDLIEKAKMIEDYIIGGSV